MSPRPFTIAVISPPEMSESEPARVNQLFDAGLECFYLRKPGCARHEMMAYLRKLDASALARVLIGSHHELVMEFGLKGAHLPTTKRLDGEYLAACSLLRARHGYHLSTSVHSVLELRSLGHDFDFAFISPAFGYFSKRAHGSAMANDDLVQAARNSKPVAYALGGVDQEGVKRAFDLGFRGVGILGAVWSARDPVSAYSDIYRCARAYAERVESSSC